MGILQHLNNSSRYGYVSVLHNSEVPGIVAWAHRTHIKFRAGKGMLYPYPGYLWHGRTKLTEVLCGVWVCTYQTEHNLGRFHARKTSTTHLVHHSENPRQYVFVSRTQ